MRLIVETNDNFHQVTEKLKPLYDADTHVCEYEFNRATLTNTGLISLEQIARGSDKNALDPIRIDDIKGEYCPGFRTPEVSEALVRHLCVHDGISLSMPDL